MGDGRKKLVDRAAMVRVELAREAIKVVQRDAKLSATLKAVTKRDPSDLAGVVQALTESLNSGSPVAATTLGHLADHAFRYRGNSLPPVLLDALPALVAATGAAKQDVRIAAFKALGGYGPAAGRDVLDAVMSSDLLSAHPREAAAAIDALRATGTDLAGKAVPWLVGMLEHPGRDVPMLVLQTLAWLGSEAAEAVDRLVSLLAARKRGALRIEAGKALIAVDPEGAVVSRLAIDSERRSALLDALRDMGSEGRELRSRLAKKWRRPPQEPAREKSRRAEESELLLEAALCTHHRIYDDNDEFNPKPATQKKLAKLTKWKQSKVSRQMARIFGKRPMIAYKEACKDKSRLKRALKKVGHRHWKYDREERDSDEETELVDPLELQNWPAGDD